MKKNDHVINQHTEERGDNMETVKAKCRTLSIADIFYNDTLWTVFYIFNVLYALGRVMVRFNYSSVADSNPISVFLHGGFYLVCVMAVFVLCIRAQFTRCSAMEMFYFGLRIIVLCPQFSETFSYLLAARVICILVGAFMGVTVFKKQYREMDKRYYFRWKVILPAAVLSIVLFVIVYHEYVLQMIGGAVIVAIIASWGGSGKVIYLDDVDHIVLK